MSLSEIQRMLGYVPEQVIQELGEDMKRARDAGLLLSTDAMSAGSMQPAATRQTQGQPENQDQGSP